MVVLEALPLHDCRLDPALEEELDDGDVDQRQRDDPEVARAEDGREQEREGDREDPVRPGHVERPLERAVERAVLIAHRD